MEELSIDVLIEKVGELIEKYGKKKICERIVEQAEFLNPYDERLDTIFEILDRYCGGAYVVKLKQALKTRLSARRSPVSPEIISILGAQTAYLIHEVFNPATPLRILNSMMDKMMTRIYVETPKREPQLPDFMDILREAIMVS